jgi:hypothetical protein
MSQAEFQIKITPTGDVQIEVIGAEGQTCTDLSAFLEDALGEVEDRRFKSEYYTGQIQSSSNTKHRIENQQY